MSNEPTLTSALDTISKIGRTTNEYARRGLERLTRLPLIAEHRDNIAAHAAALGNSAVTPLYTPYTRFKPRDTPRSGDVTQIATGEDPCTTQNSSPVVGDGDKLNVGNANLSRGNFSAPVSSNGDRHAVDFSQSDSPPLPSNTTTNTSDNTFIQPHLQDLQSSSNCTEISDTDGAPPHGSHSRPPLRTRMRHLPYQSSQVTLRRQSSLAGQPSSLTAGDDPTNPTCLSRPPPSLLDIVDASHLAVSRADCPSLSSAVVLPPIVSPGLPFPPTQMTTDSNRLAVSHVGHFLSSSEVPTAVIPAGSASLLTQMNVVSNHSSVSPSSCPSLPLVDAPSAVSSTRSSSPLTHVPMEEDSNRFRTVSQSSLPTQTAADPNHLAVPPVDHFLSPSPEVPPTVSAGSASLLAVDSSHRSVSRSGCPSLPSAGAPCAVSSARSSPPPTHIPLEEGSNHPRTVSQSNIPPFPTIFQGDHPLAPSITVSPSGGSSSSSIDTQMDVDPDLRVSQSGSSNCPAPKLPPAATENSSAPPSRLGLHLPSSSSLDSPRSGYPGSAAARPTRPIQPRVLPTVLEDVIGQVVCERLDATAATLVDSTVRGIIDACIPRLAELIDSRFATLKRGDTNRQPEDMGTDGDDENEGDAFPKTSFRRKKPGPRGKMNRLHNAFRKYLRSKNVIPQNSKGVLPPLASNDAVQSFNRDGESPPMLEKIALDWCCSPLKSSRWNCEVITLLSVDFHKSIRDGMYQDVIYNEDTMNLPIILKLCEQKLVRTQQAYRKQIKIEATTAAERDNVLASFAMKDERRRKAERMTSRRHGTLARRKKIVLQNRFRNPEVWDAVDQVVARLDVEGMSGDETDNPPGFNPKTLRRLELPWINPAMSRLLKAVESYESALRQENMSEQIGNSSLCRYWEAARKDTKSRPVAGLPCNWYDDEWYQGLTAGARSMLASSKDVEIPTLNPFDS